MPASVELAPLVNPDRTGTDLPSAGVLITVIDTVTAEKTVTATRSMTLTLTRWAFNPAWQSAQNTRRSQMAEIRLTLSVDEAASLLGISRALAYELIARDELPSLRLGRRIVVPRRALEQLVEQASEPA